MQLVDQIRGKLQKESVSVLKMSNETGISAYKIYKWLDGKGNPKADDAVIIKKWLSGNLDKVPNSNNGNIAVAAEGPGDLPVLDRLMKQLESRADELKADKERLYGIIETYLNSILAGSVKTQEDLKILKAQADMVIKQIARQDEAILVNQLQKSEIVKGDKVKRGV